MIMEKTSTLSELNNFTHKTALSEPCQLLPCQHESPVNLKNNDNQSISVISHSMPANRETYSLKAAYNKKLREEATDLHGNELGKLFIGGLSQKTNDHSLRNYFSQFGEVDQAVVMMDQRTGRSRGFGYVKFNEPELAEEVVSLSKTHLLDDKEIDVKNCNVFLKGRNKRSLKIFVGGIPSNENKESVETFFKRFGEVTNVNLMTDLNKKRHRGFAFVGFTEESTVRTLIAERYVLMNGKRVEIKAMEPPFQKHLISNDIINNGGPTLTESIRHATGNNPNFNNQYGLPANIIDPILTENGMTTANYTHKYSPEYVVDDACKSVHSGNSTSYMQYMSGYNQSMCDVMNSSNNFNPSLVCNNMDSLSGDYCPLYTVLDQSHMMGGGFDQQCVLPLIPLERNQISHQLLANATIQATQFPTVYSPQIIYGSYQ